MQGDHTHHTQHHLTPADAQAIDAALEAWLAAHPGAPQAWAPSAEQVEKVTHDAGAQDDPRLRRAIELLHVIAHCPSYSAPANLTARTLETIEQDENRRRMAMQIQALAGPTTAFHWRELIGVAAVVLIGVSVLWPMLAHARDEARRIACQNNLAAAGMGLAKYAGDNDGLMPRMASNSANWAAVGLGSDDAGKTYQSNPAHLYRLVRQGYVTPQTLACPDNPSAPRSLAPDAQDWPNARAVSYSYQNQFTPRPIHLDASPGLATLADKNPLFVARADDPRRVVYRSDLQPTSATMFHRQAGQNVLAAGGAVTWRVDPVLPNGDNIWLSGGILNYVGNERPSQPDDSFLVP